MPRRPRSARRGCRACPACPRSRTASTRGSLPLAGGTTWRATPRPAVVRCCGAALAILGDYVPFGIGQALGRIGGGNSLDNTLRVYRLVPTEWVLLDIRIHAVAHGFGHGVVHLWAEEGTLLATASQSTIVRMMPPHVIEAMRQGRAPTGADGDTADGAGRGPRHMTPGQDARRPV
jgi:hypothetical protein